MQIQIRAAFSIVVLLCVPIAHAVTPSPAEMDEAGQWVDRAFQDSHAPFSFQYDQHSSSDFLSSWKFDRAAVAAVEGEGFRQRTFTYLDPKTSLTVRCDVIQWNDSPTIEWTLHLKNAGKDDSPIIEQVHAIDATFPVAVNETPKFHFNDGDNAIPESYQPRSEAMSPGYSKHFACTGGRPTQIAFPYFNFAQQKDRGVIVVIGWPGQWSAVVWRDGGKGGKGEQAETGIHIVGGQELTHFRLHPGEEVRTPRVVVQFYRDGDWLRGQNLWRRWMLLHNMPHPGGKPMQPQALLCTGNFYPGLMSNAKQEIAFLQQHIDAGVNFDAWWQDAGWYPCDGVTWPKTGTWEVDRGRFPKGLREVSDFVHAHNKKSIVWFEPERVYEGTWLTENHPKWIHGGKKGGLLNIGDPACRQWLTDHIDKLLTDEGIDVYRQDFNIDPLGYWRDADAPDRQGITEIRHVEGYLAYWDELLKRHPQMYIDSCSSGGRRNDIETMKRAVPLLRSDWYNATDGQQCHTYALSLWFPFQGTGAIYPRDRYWFISSMVSSLTYGPAGAGVTPDDLTIAREMTELHRKMGDCFFGDFYPLTPYTLSPHEWVAWQYDQPGKDEGVVQAFRRDQSVYDSVRLRLNGLKRDGRYEVTNLRVGESTRLSGQELTESGLPIKLPHQPDAAVIRYRLLPQEKR